MRDTQAGVADAFGLLIESGSRRGE